MKNIVMFIVFIGLAVNIKSQTILFSDDFENGPAQWSLQGTWGVTSSISNSPSYSLTDSPDGDYTNNEASCATLLYEMDLSGYLSANVSFNAVFSLENDFDFVVLQASDDDFNTYTEIYSFTGEHDLSAVTVWDEYSFSLGAYVGKTNVKVRFKITSDAALQLDGFYIDDITITAGFTDNQLPVITYTPPAFFKSSVDPFVVEASIVDVSGISSTFLNFSVDGLIQSAEIQGVAIGADSFQYIIPALPAGTFVEFWLTAIDNSPSLNTALSPVYKYVAGNHIYYDDGITNYFAITGPESNSPGNIAWAVRFTLPDETSNLVTALIRNYGHEDYPNDSMLIHVWKADSSGGVGNDLIPPFLVYPEAGPDDNLAITRIDLRSFGSQLMDLSGDIFVGYTVPSGVVNLMLYSPGITQRSYYQNSDGWYISGSDYMIRVVSGSNENDLKLVELVAPQSGDYLGANEPIQIKVKNNGTNPQSNIPVSFAVNGGSPVYDTITEVIHPHDSVYFTFSQTFDFSAFGPYSLDVVIDLPGDQNPDNNHLPDTIIHTQFQICDTLHYDNNLYTGIGLTGGGTFKVAVRYPADLLFSHTGGDVNLVRIYLKNFPTSCRLKIWNAGTSGSPGSEILSQDISEDVMAGWNEILLTNAVEITGDDLWVGYELTHYSNQYPAGLDAGPPNPDGCWLQIGNNPWSTTIGNWNIRAVICEGAENVDAGITGFITPVSSAGLTASEHVTVKVRNSGYTTVTQLPVCYVVNGGIPVQDTISDTIVTGETYVYTFPQTVDLSVDGAYDIDVYASLAGDMNSYNDHYYKTISHISFTECDTLHYDGDHLVNMGLSTGGTFKIAARFPAYQVAAVVSGMISSVMIYIKDLPTSLIIKIWSIGNSSGPGNELYSMDVTSQLLYNSWNKIELNTPVIVGTEGFWAGYQITHSTGKNPVGCDGGSVNINGNWWSITAGTWSHPPGYTNFGNWNIRAEVCPVETPGATLEGLVRYANTGQTGIGNATVSLYSGTSLYMQTQTDAGGHYQFTEVSQGNYTVIVSCNNPWGGGNAVDGLMVLRHFVGLSPLSGLFLQAADVTADGNVNSLDGLNIVRRFVGLINGFAAGDWIFEEKTIDVSSPGIIHQDFSGLCTGDTDGSYMP